MSILFGRNYREKVKLAHGRSRTRNSFRFENADVGDEWNALVTFVRIAGKLTIALNEKEYEAPAEFRNNCIACTFAAAETLIIRSCAIRLRNGRSVHSDWSERGGLNMLAGDVVEITLPGPDAQPVADANSPNFGKVRVQKIVVNTAGNWLD